MPLANQKAKQTQPTKLTPPPKTVASNDDYPLETCFFSGEKLGEMGEPVVLMHEGTEVRLCCEKCVPKFKADPEKHLAELDNAKK